MTAVPVCSASSASVVAVGKAMSGKSIAVAGMWASLSLVTLYFSALVPTGQLGVVALSGLMPAAVLISRGLSAALLCYGGTGILALLLLPSKSNALLYLLFFGCYPMVKYAIEQLRRMAVEIVLKLCFLNLMLTGIYLLLQELFFSMVSLPEWGVPLTYLVLNLAFLVYDYGFSKLIYFYTKRVAPHVK